MKGGGFTITFVKMPRKMSIKLSKEILDWVGRKFNFQNVYFSENNLFINNIGLYSWHISKVFWYVRGWRNLLIQTSLVTLSPAEILVSECYLSKYLYQYKFVCNGCPSDFYIHCFTVSFGVWLDLGCCPLSSNNR